MGAKEPATAADGLPWAIAADDVFTDVSDEDGGGVMIRSGAFFSAVAVRV